MASLQSTQINGYVLYATSTVGLAAYDVAVGTGATVKWTLRRTDGTTVTTNQSAYVYRVKIVTTGTGTDTGTMFLAHNVDGVGWVVRTVHRDGVGSNHPYLFVDSDGLPKVTIDHPSNYTVRVIVEETNGGNSGATYGMYGADAIIGYDGSGNTKIWTGSTLLFGANTVLHSGNYNSYSPTLTGGGASGTWGIGISGNAGSVTNGVYTNVTNTITNGDNAALIVYGASTYNAAAALHIGGWSTDTTYARIRTSNGNLHIDTRGGAGNVYQMYFNHYSSGDMYFGNGGGTVYIYGGRLRHSDGTPYITNSGTWGISITGNADTVDGYHASTSTIGNYIVVRDGNGYIFGNYINMTDDGNPGGGTAITSFITKQGDNYYRSVSPTNAMSSIRGVASGTWGISISGTSANTNSISSATGGSYTWTSTNYFQSNLGGYCGSLSSPPLQAYCTGANSAFMSFHRSGNYAVNMGLDADNVLRIGGWSASANRWELDMSGNCWVASSFRAPYFYDSNDTGYYLKPSGESKIKKLWINNGGAAGVSWSTGLNMGDSANYWNLIQDAGTARQRNFGTGGYDWYNNSASTQLMLLSNSGNLTVSGDMRAPRFYDSDNTSYYLDPASTSILNGLQVGGSAVVTNNGGTWNINVTGSAGSATTAARATRANGNFYIDDNYGNTIVGVYDSTRYQGVFAMGDAYKLPANGTGPGNLYGLAWSHPNAGGVAGNLNDHGLLVINNGVFAAAISSSIRAAADMRAPIFYDYNDTSYYLDPNGTSNLNTLTTSTRARWGQSRYWMDRSSITPDQGYWTGTQGWGMGYGGWGSAWKGGFSGWDIWGTSTDHPQGSGYVHAQGIVSGQHFTTSDGGSAYGWMIVGAADATPNRYWLRGKWGSTTSSWTEMMTSNNNPYAWNMNQYVRTTDSVSFSSVAVNGGAAGYMLGVNGNIYCTSIGNALYANGNIYATGDVTAYSDARVKTNIRSIENALDRVLKSRGVIYDRNDKESNNNIGFIAQELEEQFPELVSTDEQGHKGVKYQNMVAVLLEAVKEQQKEIDKLKSKLV